MDKVIIMLIFLVEVIQIESVLYIDRYIATNYAHLFMSSKIETVLALLEPRW